MHHLKLLQSNGKFELIKIQAKKRFAIAKAFLNKNESQIKKYAVKIGVPVVCAGIFMSLCAYTFAPKSVCFESSIVNYMEQPTAQRSVNTAVGENLVNAYGIYFGSEFVGVTEDENTLEAALSEVLNSAKAQYKNSEAAFDCTVTAEKGLYSKDGLLNEKELRNIITNSFGKHIKVTQTVEETVSVPYSVSTVFDATKSEDYSMVKQEGVNGSQRVTSEIVYVNGKKQSAKVVSTKTIIAASPKIIVTGERLSEGYSTGKFIWPCPYTKSIYSGFGYREDGYHGGIDINESGIYGADIVASDGGTVICAQYDSYGYGYHIEIDHGNGFVTRYAHCSDIYVSVGDKVSSGTVIGAVGSTGDSEAPHLHFEIIKDGERLDPEIYV